MSFVELQALYKAQNFLKQSLAVFLLTYILQNRESNCNKTYTGTLYKYLLFKKMMESLYIERSVCKF